MKPTILVSGLPRSGTSMMMRMLDAAGFDLLLDGKRGADDDNPRGYYEYEPVMGLKADNGWLDAAEGKVLKVVSPLLEHLPLDRPYKVLFMRRDLDECLESQRKMLVRRGEVGAVSAESEAADAALRKTYILHLGVIERYLADQEAFTTLFVNYKRMLEAPDRQVPRVARFLASELGQSVDEAVMSAVIEPALYRNRKG
jgi:hypothetical protein